MRWMAVAAAFLVLAACGGDDGGSTFSSRSASAVADRIGCDGFVLSREVKLLTREHGTCDYTGEQLSISTYTADEQRQVAKLNFGGVQVQGDGWIVYCATEAVARKVQGRVGGTIR